MATPVETEDNKENEEEGDENEEESGSDETKKTSNGEKKLTQAEVTRIATREKQEGTKAGRLALLKELGITDPKEATRLIELAKKAEEETLSDTEKANKKAQDAAVEAEKDREEAKKERLASRVERSLLANGLSLPKDEDKADKALSRAVRLLDLDLDASQDDIKAAVKELKVEMPALFASPDDEEEESGDSPERTGRTDPGRPPRGKKATGTAKDRASSLLAQRHPTSVKK